MPHSTGNPHFFPGTEKNTDMAQVFRRVGFNVVVFSYRGNWGSKGSYSFENCVQDVQNVISYIYSNADNYRIKSNDIRIIGYSLGGFLALYTGFKNENIKKIASISGFHLQITKEVFKKDERHYEIIKDLVENSMNALEGTNAEKILEEIHNIDTWDFDDFYNVLAMKDVCLIAGLKDNIVPASYYHFPMISELEKHKMHGSLTHTTFYDAYHSYSDHRIKLTKYLLKWLKDN